jgi:uncharacterized protein YbaP (TraB family)
MPKNHHTIFIILLLPLLFLARPALTQEEPAPQPNDNLPLWLIPGTDTQATVYLLADFTLLGPRDFPLPEPIENAYTQADAVVTYLKDDPDPGQIFQTALQQHGQTTTSLQDTLPQDDWQLLQENLAQLGIDPAQFQNLSPWATAILLHQVAAARQDRQQRYTLNNYFTTKARVDGKPVLGVTTAHTFFDGITALPPDAQNAFLRQTLREIAMMTANRDEFRVNWQIGNMDALHSLMQRSRVESRPLQDLLQQQPTRIWLQSLQKIQGAHPGKTLLALIPLNLMSGPDSLPQQMRHNTAPIRQLTTPARLNE